MVSIYLLLDTEAKGKVFTEEHKANMKKNNWKKRKAAKW